jgi:hypothetical protein
VRCSPFEKPLDSSSSSSLWPSSLRGARRKA